MKNLNSEKLSGVGVQLLKMLDKKIGTNEVLIWGLKASSELRVALSPVLTEICTKKNRKVVNLD